MGGGVKTGGLTSGTFSGLLENKSVKPVTANPRPTAGKTNSDNSGKTISVASASAVKSSPTFSPTFPIAILPDGNLLSTVFS